MTQLILQYMLIVVLVVGLAYFVYLLREKGINIEQDYFGIARTILGFLQGNESTPENAKNILRLVSQAVNYVEANYKEEDNDIKEEKALVLAQEAIEALKLEKGIPEDNIRQLIRMCAAFMPPTNKKEA